MSGNVELVEGWTGPLEFQLLADGAAQNLTGMTVTMLLYKSDGTVIDTTGDITVTDAATGEVTYNPDAADLAATDSPLTFRFKVVDSSSKVVYFPNEDRNVIKVNSP